MSTIRERNGKWQAIVRVKKAGVVVHSEAATFDTERLARDWAQRLEKRVRADGVGARKLARKTFADLIDDYREMREAAKPMGRSMHHDLDMLRGAVGAHGLCALTPEVWTKLARSRSADGAGPATILHNLSTARTVLNAAKSMFGLEVDGASVTGALESLARVNLVARSERRDRRLRADEMPRLVSEFERIQPNPSTQIPMHVITPLAVAFPRRLGELCSMRWADYTDGVMTLRDTKHPRRARTETVPVPPVARAILDTLPKIDERILPYKSDSVSASFERACDRLKIDNLRFHDLRHEGICRLFEFGLSIPEVSMISGHMSWSTLKRYTHLRPQDVLEKMDARS